MPTSRNFSSREFLILQNRRESNRRDAEGAERDFEHGNTEARREEMKKKYFRFWVVLFVLAFTGVLVMTIRAKTDLALLYLIVSLLVFLLRIEPMSGREDDEKKT